MGPGFYKNDNGTLLYGPTQVCNLDYDLHAVNCADYTYPVDGWYWFDTEEAARLALNIPLPVVVDNSGPIFG